MTDEQMLVALGFSHAEAIRLTVTAGTHTQHRFHWYQYRKPYHYYRCACGAKNRWQLGKGRPTPYEEQE